MQQPDSRPSIGSLVQVQATGEHTPYFALVVGHRRIDQWPAVEVVSEFYEGKPYKVFVEFVRVVK